MPLPIYVLAAALFVALPAAAQGPQAEAPPQTLHEAAAQHNTAAAIALLESGAEINAPDANGNTPLHQAVPVDVPAIAALIGVQAPPDAAAEYKRGLETLALLIVRGADVSARNQRGHTALHEAALKRSGEAALLLLRNGADANAQTAEGLTPLHFAAMLEHVEIATLLLKHGANAELLTNETAGEIAGKTALQLARGKEMKALLGE